jgi:hypothetical protein
LPADADDAYIAQCINSTAFGLTAGVFSADHERAKRILRYAWVTDDDDDVRGKMSAAEANTGEYFSNHCSWSIKSNIRKCGSSIKHILHVSNFEDDRFVHNRILFIYVSSGIYPQTTLLQARKSRHGIHQLLRHGGAQHAVVGTQGQRAGADFIGYCMGPFGCSQSYQIANSNGINHSFLLMTKRIEIYQRRFFCLSVSNKVWKSVFVNRI